MQGGCVLLISIFQMDSNAEHMVLKQVESLSLSYLIPILTSNSVDLRNRNNFYKDWVATPSRREGQG